MHRQSGIGSRGGGCRSGTESCGGGRSGVGSCGGKGGHGFRYRHSHAGTGIDMDNDLNVDTRAGTVTDSVRSCREVGGLRGTSYKRRLRNAVPCKKTGSPRQNTEK